jgi:hypothetical protein
MLAKQKARRITLCGAKQAQLIGVGHVFTFFVSTDV